MLILGNQESTYCNGSYFTNDVSTFPLHIKSNTIVVKTEARFRGNMKLMHENPSLNSLNPTRSFVRALVLQHAAYGPKFYSPYQRPFFSSHASDALCYSVSISHRSFPNYFRKACVKLLNTCGTVVHPFLKFYAVKTQFLCIILFSKRNIYLIS
jgi:hypothetical protein